MKILVGGSHGLVGQALIKSLTSDEHEVHRLVRHERVAGAPEIEWQPNRRQVDEKQLEGFDAVVHLGGENIAEGRWTDEKKKRIRDSRINGTELLSTAIAHLSRPPATFLCASATGYYGDRGDELLTEQSVPGQDFLANVCVEWERATAPAAEKGIRTVNTRFGIILDQNGGALAKMLPPFRMGVGGRIGDGKQWMSWIGLDDVVQALRFVLTTETLSGPVNFVSPEPVTNAQFTKLLGKALSRPTFFPIPAFGVRLAFGEMADALLLASQRVKPELLERAGYKFKFHDLKTALEKIL